MTEGLPEESKPAPEGLPESEQAKTEPANSTLGIKLTAAEKASIEQAAKEAGVSTSAYARAHLITPASAAPEQLAPLIVEDARRLGVLRDLFIDFEKRFKADANKITGNNLAFEYITELEVMVGVAIELGNSRTANQTNNGSG